MGIPDEDKGPAWLRDWGNKTNFTDVDAMTGYVDSSALSVDINTLVAFAHALQAEHENDFRPHVRMVFDDMAATPAPPDARFVELTESMTHHREMLVQTSTALSNHDKAVIAFVQAAEAISQEYRGADAMSAARVGDVDTQLAAPPPATATKTVTPQQASNTISGSPDGGKVFTDD